eukprot:11177234-Lingulodinium_polyedra.AAC.1
MARARSVLRCCLGIACASHACCCGAVSVLLGCCGCCLFGGACPATLGRCLGAAWLLLTLVHGAA